MESIGHFNIDKAQISYFEKKINITFKEEIETPLFFYLYSRYFKINQLKKKIYTVKTDKNSIIRKNINNELLKNIEKIEEFVSAIYATEKTDYADSGHSFAGEITGIEIRYEGEFFKEINLKREYEEIITGYRLFIKNLKYRI